MAVKWEIVRLPYLHEFVNCNSISKIHMCSSLLRVIGGGGGMDATTKGAR